MREALARVAPGQPLREGLDRILQASNRLLPGTAPCRAAWEGGYAGTPAAVLLLEHFGEEHIGLRHAIPLCRVRRLNHLHHASLAEDVRDDERIVPEAQQGRGSWG